MFPLSQDTYHAQWIDSQTFFMDTIWHDMRFRVEGMVLRGMFGSFVKRHHISQRLSPKFNENSRFK